VAIVIWGVVIWIALAVITGKWLRQRVPWFQRLNDFNWQALVLVDVVAAFVIFWPLYLLAVLDDRPLPWSTISTMCGYYALQGKAWAKISASLIDALFFALTGQRGHCLKSYYRWAAPLA
jgi:hypothetical protein